VPSIGLPPDECCLSSTVSQREGAPPRERIAGEAVEVTPQRAGQAAQLFGSDLPRLLDELNEALAA
jgi:hypothetical protein